MGYGRAMLAKDAGEEKQELEAKMKKKGLMGAIGGTLGGLLATVFTGGLAAPWAVGLATGASSAAGKAIAGGSVKLPKGKFYKGDRAGAEDMFKQDIWTTALTSSVLGGMGAKIDQMKGVKEGTMAADATKGKGFDIANSPIGKSKFVKNIGAKGKYEDLFSSQLGGDELLFEGGKGSMIKRKNITAKNPKTSFIEQNIARDVQGNPLQQTQGPRLGDTNFGMDQDALLRMLETDTER